MGDLLFNLCMLAADAAALWVVRRRRGVVGVLLGALLAAASCAVLALLVASTHPNHRQFAVIRYLAWGFFAHGPALALVGARVLRERRVWRFGLAGLALAILAVGVEAFVREPRALELTRYTVRTTKLDRPLRIGVIADLQTDAPGEYERSALEALMAAEPDVILFAGDYVQILDGPGRAQGWRELNAIFHEVGLAAPLGVHAVEGDVDGPDDLWRWVFDGIDAELYTQTRPVDLTWGGRAVRITGIAKRAGVNPRLELEPPPSGAFHIALAHHPDFALGDAPADLMVAGHTHGGQVQLPLLGPVITLSKVPRAWASGRTELSGGRTLVVSRGVGMERGRAPRLRFLCPPEVVVIDVVPGAVDG